VWGAHEAGAGDGRDAQEGRDVGVALLVGDELGLGLLLGLEIGLELVLVEDHRGISHASLRRAVRNAGEGREEPAPPCAGSP